MNIEKVKLKDGSEYPLGGSWNNLTDKPIHTVQTVLFSDAVKSFSYVSNYGSYIYETNDASLLKKWYTVWKKAIVTIDGVQYLPKKQTADGENYLGDALRLQTGSAVTGEPYAIGVTNGYFVFALFVDSVPEDTSVKVEHTISITLENDVIQNDYLPELPEFDLTAMGLGAVVPGGGQQSVTCDVTDLISAMKKGTVKLCLNTILGTDSNGTPQVTPFNIIGNAIYLEGSLYEIISSVSYYGTNMQVLVWVNKEEGKLYSLATIDEPPTFNLTNMGLSEIPMDGTVVSVSCDTTGLITALNKGAVKLISKVKFSETVTHDYTCIVNAGVIGNEYNCTMCGVMSGVPMMISFAATPSRISAYITALAVPTTTTTETGTT